MEQAERCCRFLKETVASVPGQKYRWLPEIFSCVHILVASLCSQTRLVRLTRARQSKNQLKNQADGKMSEEQAAAAAEPVPEAKEPITLRVRDQVSIDVSVLFFRICGLESYHLHKTRAPPM